MKNQKRYYGLDLLKIISMLGIIQLHIVGQGGINAAIATNTISHFILLLYYIVIMASVNIFAMVSGFLYYDKKTKYKNIINLISIVIFYCIVVTTIFYSFNLYDIRNLGLYRLVSSLLPLFESRYWYITCYAILFLFIPYLNLIIEKTPKRNMKNVLIVLFIIFCIVPLFFGGRDIFRIYSGYSVLWLSYCYLIGAYVHKYYNSFKNFPIKKIITLFLLVVFMGSILNYVFINNNIPHFVYDTTVFFNYTSPFVVTIALLFLITFLRINCKKNTLLAFFSKSNFSTYISYGHILIFDFVFPVAFIFITGYNILIQIPLVIICSLIIYISLSITDRIRMAIYKYTKLDNVIDILGNKLDKYLLKK